MCTRKPNYTKGVLLCAYGSPTNQAEVKPYLEHIKNGPVSPQLLKLVSDRYKKIGGCSPLLEITRKQGKLMQEALEEQGRSLKVYIGMKHWHPFIKDVLVQISNDGVEELLVIALAPHFSSMSVGGYEKAVNEAVKLLSMPMAISYIKSWHKNPWLVECIVEQTKKALENFENPEAVEIIFTAHSLPERICKWHDPYEKELLTTSRLAAKKLNHKNWNFSFQSAGKTKESWLGPDILETLSELKKEQVKDALVVPVGFVSDHLETLYDIDVEAANYARQLGIRISRAESRNTHSLFIKALTSLIQRIPRSLLRGS